MRFLHSFFEPRTRTLGWTLIGSVAALSSITTGCRKHDANAQPDGATSIEEIIEAGVTEVLDAGATTGGGSDELKIAATFPVSPIYNVTEFPAKDPAKAAEERQGATRLGYLRRGELVAVKPKIIKKSNCPEGWYELTTGGFVCGKYATTDMSSRDLLTAPHPPWMDRPLPYDYGLNLTNGTPLYRRRPKRAERAEFEKGLAIGKTKKGDAGTSESSDGADGEKAWYQRDHKGQRPLVTIDDLKSEEGEGLVALRMVRGFYIAIDKEMKGSAGRYFRTTAGLLAPRDFIVRHATKTEFQGVQIGSPGETRHLPLGWIVSPRARKYRFDESDDGKAPKRGDTLDRFSIAQLTGKTKTSENRVYYETDEGFWLRDIEIAVSKPGPAPSDLSPGEKWIDVNLSTQTLIAFEGDKPVFATIISSGRHDDSDPSKDHRTAKGSFRIREKHVSATMDDDSATDGPYSIQDVPWIMYFEKSFALHGAFWHSAFGRERSHGCVNLQPIDARYLFGWAEPLLPSGWHGMVATKEHPGTRVIVHD